VTLLISAAGTGGHVFPALALGESLRKYGWNLLYIGRKKSFEETMIRNQGFDFHSMPASGFFGKSFINKIKFMLNLLLASGHWINFILHNRFKAVIVTGGFSSLVPILGAIFLNKPFFILEQNCIPGRITKYFSRFAKEVYLGFPLVQSIKGSFYNSGNPLRPALVDAALRAKINRENSHPIVLVLGGSQGARALNLAAVELANKYQEVRFIIQTGKRDYDLIKYKIESDNCQLVDFTLTPEENYLKADFVITRAGGMVLSELLAFGIPSIIIPFPFATDRHQAANARFLEKKGVSIILNQDHLHELENIFQNLIMDKERLRKMGENALCLARYDAAQKISERITKCLVN
jgi:UDP-N-acetylglucosamine--N-acetylmuramyl-(pentapeptide) pyrophosphoryl-undecaprenol N-acetylglucosamine transferase